MKADAAEVGGTRKVSILTGTGWKKVKSPLFRWVKWIKDESKNFKVVVGIVSREHEFLSIIVPSPITS